MDIKTLSDRTGAPIRQIRYIIDNQMVPDGAWSVNDQAVGRARTFNNAGAVYVACAALLLNAGYKRDSITHLMRAVTSPVDLHVKGMMPLKISPFEYTLERDCDCTLRYADGLYFQWIVDEIPTEWIDVTKLAIARQSFTPKVLLVLDIGEIRNLVLGRK